MSTDTEQVTRLIRIACWDCGTDLGASCAIDADGRLAWAGPFRNGTGSEPVEEHPRCSPCARRHHLQTGRTQIIEAMQNDSIDLTPEILAVLLRVAYDAIKQELASTEWPEQS